MFGKKRWMTVILAWMLALVWACPAFADGTISSVSVKITSDIEAGNDYGEVNVTTSNSKYYVEDYYITNQPDGEWKRGNKPKVKITLGAEDGYSFKSSFSKSNITLSGTEATVSSVSRSKSTLVINVTLSAIDEGDGGYDLEVYDLQWDESTGEGYWEENGDAKRYEVKIYRGSSLQNSSTLTTDNTYYDFSEYLTRSGTYTFRVRGVYSSSYKGKWQESESFYVDSSTARDFREASGSSSDTSSDSNSGGPSGGSGNTGGPGQDGTGAWLKDSVGWWYCNADRSYTVNNWQYINNKWYYFNERGYMVTGWVHWKNVYYYCGPDGDMWVSRWTPDGYYVDGNGVWVQNMRR